MSTAAAIEPAGPRRRTRVLITACPMYGHVNTLLPLAVAARRAGHEVVVATGPDLAGLVQRQGLTAWPVGPTFDEAGGLPRSPADFAVTGEKRATDLLPRALDWRPDVVVHEETELAGLLLAARGGIRHAVHGLGINASGSWEVYSALVDELGVRHGLPGLAATLRAATFLSICPPSLQPAGTAWPRIRPIRPAFGLPEPGEQLPAAVEALPYPRTVHLTLGTVLGGASALATALAGLRILPVNVVVTVGPGIDPAGLGRQPANVVVERYLPHTLLLPRCDLVVSHGGAGILLGALTHGLPQLVLPQSADQFGNAAAVRAAGAALVLGPDELSAAAVTTAATQLLDRPQFRNRARALAAEIDAMPGPEDVAGQL